MHFVSNCTSSVFLKYADDLGPAVDALTMQNVQHIGSEGPNHAYCPIIWALFYLCPNSDFFKGDNVRARTRTWNRSITMK